jgi:hypothetical protein
LKQVGRSPAVVITIKYDLRAECSSGRAPRSVCLIARGNFARSVANVEKATGRVHAPS